MCYPLFLTFSIRIFGVLIMVVFSWPDNLASLPYLSLLLMLLCVFKMFFPFSKINFLLKAEHDDWILGTVVMGLQ